MTSQLSPVSVNVIVRVRLVRVYKVVRVVKVVRVSMVRAMVTLVRVHLSQVQKWLSVRDSVTKGSNVGIELPGQLKNSLGPNCFYNSKPP